MPAREIANESAKPLLSLPAVGGRRGAAMVKVGMIRGESGRWYEDFRNHGLVGAGCLDAFA